jgi:DNA-binding transcriptional LysR family regulator
MDDFDNIAVFLSVYEQGGLSAAARALGRSLQSVSRALIGLEQELGVELIRRTTRKSVPTEAGVDFYQRVKPAYNELREAKLEAANRRVEPAGLLRVGASVQFAPAYLVPAAAAFMKQHPKVQVELVLSDAFVDLVDANLDLALRIGHLPDSELRARKLGAMRRVVFGAPSYFAERGKPRRPEDLRRHECVLRTAGSSDAKWPFLVDGKARQVAVSGRFRATHTAAMVRAAVEGLGLGFTPYWQVRDLIATGALEVVLTAFEAPPVPIHVLWAGQRGAPAKTRRFIDFLESALKKADLSGAGRRKA